MTGKFLLSVHLEVALAVIYHYLIVHGLSSEVFHVGMHRSSRYGMHVWLTDVLGDDWDTELPDVDLLIVRSGDKSSPVFYECYGVNGAQMFLILLNDFFRVCVELEDFLVRAPS